MDIKIVGGKQTIEIYGVSCKSFATDGVIQYLTDRKNDVVLSSHFDFAIKEENQKCKFVLSTNIRWNEEHVLDMIVSKANVAISNKKTIDLSKEFQKLSNWNEGIVLTSVDGSKDFIETLKNTLPDDFRLADPFISWLFSGENPFMRIEENQQPPNVLSTHNFLKKFIHLIWQK